MDKICKKCGISKNLDKFYKQKSKDGRHSYCKICAVENAKKHYKTNKKVALSRMKTYNNKFKNQTKMAVNKIKKELGCCFCDEFEPCCLDFHHLNPKEKEFTVSRLLSTKNIKTIVQEINKCICVCSNCHRKIHAGYLTVNFNDQINIKEDDILLDRDNLGLIGRTKEKIIKFCECGAKISKNSRNCKKCASAMNTVKRIKNSKRPLKEELEKIVWEMPTTKVAKKYGVSDSAVGKWCKYYGIIKPSLGYWTKQKYKKL